MNESEQDTAYKIKLGVKRMDYLGKEYTSDNIDSDQIETTVAYLKLINVPTMFDIGCNESDPTTSFLTLNMIDEKTYKVEKMEFIDAK